MFGHFSTPHYLLFLVAGLQTQQPRPGMAPPPMHGGMNGPPMPGGGGPQQAPPIQGGMGFTSGPPVNNQRKSLDPDSMPNPIQV